MLNLSLATKIISEKEARVSKFSPVNSLGVTDDVEGLEQSEATLEASDETGTDGEGI